jgi:ribosomal subunit interface protein
LIRIKGAWCHTSKLTSGGTTHFPFSGKGLVMQMPLQITLKHLSNSEALITRIRARAAKLESKHARIASCRVTVEQLDKHAQQGGQFRVVVDLRVPGAEIAASIHHDQDVYVAVRKAFDAVRRRLARKAAAQSEGASHSFSHRQIAPFGARG